MATVYSLVCWGGRTGKTVTLTVASPCVITSTNHGLRDGTGLRFKSNSDTLPTGLTSGVTYYAKSTAANTFNLYSDAALTTIINTSGSQSGTHILQSLLVANPSSALAAFGLSDLSRWGSSGSERIYDGIAAWNSGRSGASAFDEEIAELGESFIESLASTITINAPSAVTRITSLVNGVRSPAFHAGVINSGYILYRTASSNDWTITLPSRCTLDGFTVRNNNGGYDGPCISSNNLTTVRYMIALGVKRSYSTGISVGSPFSVAEYCLAMGWATGFSIQYGVAGQTIRNCIASKCTNGIQAGGTNQQGDFYNNISVGNTDNDYYGITGTSYGAGYNIAETNGLGGYLHGSPWASGSNPSYAMATTDVVSFGSASWAITDNLRPAAASSPQVDAGIAYYQMVAADITGGDVPSYNNGGAEAADIGAYEFDRGYGPRPASTTVTFSGVNAGSEIRVYDNTGAALDGVESCVTDQTLTWTVSASPVTVRIVHPNYKIKEFTYTNVEGTVSLPVQQEIDPWYSNPV